MKQKSSTILPTIPTAVAPLHEVAKEGFPFRNLVDQAPVAICVFRGADFVLEVVNERFLHLLGKTKEQVINMPVFTALPILFGQGYEELLAGVYKTGIACNVSESPTTFNRNGKEEVIYANLIYEPLYDAKHKIDGVFAVVTDVTDQVLARKKIEESKNQLQNIFLNAPAAIAIFEGPEYKYILANKAYEKLTNRNADDLLGKSFHDVFPELKDTGVFELFDTIFKNKEPYTAPEYPAIFDVKNDGVLKQCYFNFSMEPLKNDAGEIYATIAMIFDITEQVEARKKVVENEQRKAFLLTLTDTLRLLNNTSDIEKAVTKITRNFLDADWCMYATIEEDILVITHDAVREGLTSVAGKYYINNFVLFKAILDAGHPFIVNDVQTTDVLDDELKQLCIQLQNISFIIVPVIKNGKPLGLMSIVQNQPRNWTGTEVQLAIETAERTWAALEKAKSEEALRKSEEKYRMLFNAIDEGVSTIEIIFDENEKAIDFRFLESNPAMTKATGLTNEIHGKTAKEVLPNIEEFWLETYGKVVKTGESIRFEYTSKDLNSNWFEVHAYKVEDKQSRKIITVYNKITDRKIEEEKQTYILKLSDAIKELLDPVDIQLTACKILGEHVKVHRVLYGEVINEEQIIISNNYVNGVSPINATLDAEQFGRNLIDAFKRNEKVIISDITTDPAYSEEAKQSFISLDVVATVGMGLIKAGRWVASFGMQDNAPRKWTATEIWLLEETAERTWAAVERAKTEQDLRKSEEKYRTLFTSIDQGFVLCELIRNKEGKGIDYYMLEINPTYETQTGLTAKMVLGKTILQVFPSIDKEHIDTFAAVVDNQCPAVFEQYFEVNHRWHSVKVYPGEKDRFTVLFSDITERKQTEQKIKESEQEIRKIKEQLELSIRAGKIGIWHWDVKNDLLYWSKEQKIIYGLEPSSELINLAQYKALVNPEDWERLNKDLYGATIAEEQEYDFRITRKNDGELRWIKSRARNSVDPQGELQFISGVNIDITEQVIALNKIQENEERFRNLAETLPQMVWVMNSDGSMEYGSKNWKEYSGIDDLAEAWDYMMHPDDRKRLTAFLNKVFADGKSYRHEVRLKNMEGIYRWFYSVGEPVLDADQKVIKWVGSLTDIEEQKNIEQLLEIKVIARTEELKHKNAELQNMNKELEAFTYVSSHDLQEPLRKIQIFAGRIAEKDKKNLSSTGKDYLRSINHAAERMRILIQDLLAFSRVNSSERKFEINSLNKIVDEVKNEFKEVLEEKKATITVKKMADVKIIRFQFRQLMQNLISNAIKFSKPNIPPHIIIKSEMVSAEKSPFEGNGAYHISVSDNGIGFEKEFNEKIFEVFQRLNGKEEYSGSGIGLAIVKKIVENHNGVIIAESELGKGATFNIYLPA